MELACRHIEEWQLYRVIGFSGGNYEILQTLPGWTDNTYAYVPAGRSVAGFFCS